MAHVTVIPGDGIGPEITAAARAVIDAAGADVQWDEQLAGHVAYEAGGNPLPGATLASIHRHRVVLKGPLTTQVGSGFRSVNVALRREFDLFANVRPAMAYDGVDCLFPGLDLVVVRENTEGLYTNMEHWIGPGHQAAMGIGINTWTGMERICRFAFDYAVRCGRKRVVAVHKANILKIFSGLFLEVAQEVSKAYPQIAFEDRIVDNTAMQLVRNPRQFDVIVTTNLFGDILSDLAAGLVGGLGLAPGANYGDDAAMFEAVHGTAPDIAGRNLANPCALILAGVLLLRHLGQEDAADRLHEAVRDVLREGKAVTRDLAGEAGVGTREMTGAILAKLDG